LTVFTVAVPPTVLYCCVSSGNVLNEETPPHWGLLCQKTKTKT
jgi:hypothetical protein